MENNPLAQGFSLGYTLIYNFVCNG